MQQPGSSEKHIAVVDFRGIQPVTPERASFTGVGPAAVEIVASLETGHYRRWAITKVRQTASPSAGNQ